MDIFSNRFSDKNFQITINYIHISRVLEPQATGPADRGRVGAGRRELLRPDERDVPQQANTVQTNLKNYFAVFRYSSHFDGLYSFYSTVAPGQDLGSGSSSRESRRDSQSSEAE